MGLSVEEAQYHAEGQPLTAEKATDPNLNAETALFILGRR